MSKLWAVNDNNDMFANANGTIALVEDEAGVDQDVKHALTSVLGEMIYSQQDGVDFYGTIFAPFPNVEAFIQSCRKNIRRKSNILSVNSFEVFKEDNIAKYETTITTSFGKQVITDVL
jgi:hypothetical protein